jgi:hypothetical protein
MQTISQPLGIVRWIELDRQFFALTHLAEIRQISTNDRNAKATR